MNGQGMAAAALAGMLKGQQRKRKREQELEDRKWKQLLIKAQLDQMKAKEAQAARSERLLERLFPGLGAEQAPAPETGAKPGDRALDMMTGQGIETYGGQAQPEPIDSLANMTPEQLALLTKATGIDFMNAARLRATLGQGQIFQRQDAKGYTRNYMRFPDGTVKPMGVRSVPKMELTEVPDGRGGTMKVPFNPYQPGQGFQSSIPEIEPYTYQKEGTTYQGFRYKHNKQDVPNMTPLPTAPPKGLPGETAGKVALVVRGAELVDQLEQMLIPGGQVNSKLIMAANTPGGGVGQGRMIRQVFLDAVDARIRAATGAAIGKDEVPMYASMYLPNMRDLMLDPSGQTVRNKLKRLRSFMTDYLIVLDPSGDMRKRLRPEGGTAPASQPATTKTGGLPPGAMMKLKEGVETTFGNGQTWTLKNGVPVRVR